MDVGEATVERYISRQALCSTLKSSGEVLHNEYSLFSFLGSHVESFKVEEIGPVLIGYLTRAS